jgi:uncharacterized protein YmfQ (DUF2313 family)
MWPRHEGTNLHGMAHGMALEGERVIQGTEQMLRARDPREAYSLLGEWETLLALPDCDTASTDVDDRQAAAYARLVNQGNYSADELIKAGASLGYTIQIKHPSSYFKAQLAVYPLGTYNLSHTSTWDRIYIFLASGSNDAQLECEIDRLIPGHMVASYFYT